MNAPQAVLLGTRDDEIKQLRVARRVADHAPVTVRTTFLGAHANPPDFEDDADGYIEFVCEQVLPAVVEKMTLA